MLRRVAAFCRPLRPVLLLVSFPRSRSPVVGVPGLCWMWRDVPFACQRRPIVGVLGLCWLLPGSFDCFCCPHTSVHRPSIACLAVFLCGPGAFLHALSGPSTIRPFPPHGWSAPDGLPLLLRKQPIWAAPPPSGGSTPLCDIPSGCCFFTGPWTVTRSSLRVLRRVAAFCRPLRPVLLPVSFPRSQSPVVGLPGLCWMWHGVPFARQRPPSPTPSWMCALLQFAVGLRQMFV